MLKALNSQVSPIQMSYFMLIELQLFFGEAFTKVNVAGPLYLSDALLGLIGFAALGSMVIRRKQPTISWPLAIMLAISVVYLVYSFVSKIGPANYIIRHYALFLYIGINYIIFESFINEKSRKNNLKFLLVIGISAVILQIIWHLYRFVTIPEYYQIFFDDFNYYTELITPGLIIFEIWVLCYVRNNLWKFSAVLFILFFSTTLGHSSAFLACFIPVGFYFAFKLKFSTLTWVLLTIAVLLGFYFFVPQFSDGNAQFRLLYWREILKQGVFEYYGVLGHGFGGSFITESINQAFLTEIDSIHFDVNPEEKYLTPMHNSFITIMFHIGILPGLLIILPLRKALKSVFSTEEISKEKIFLFLSLTGFIVWTSFNVILEMPHSSAFFWLIYFSVVYDFRKGNNKSSASLNSEHTDASSQ